MSTLTAANAIITLSVAGLFPVAHRLQGFSADNIYETPSQEVAETAMGVDGRLSAGFVYNPVEQTFIIQADSASNAFFEQWAAFQQQNQDVSPCSGQTALPSVGRTYISTRGFLVGLQPLPNAAKILQPRRYVIRWQGVQSAPV